MSLLEGGQPKHPQKLQVTINHLKERPFCHYLVLFYKGYKISMANANLTMHTLFKLVAGHATK